MNLMYVFPRVLLLCKFIIFFFSHLASLGEISFEGFLWYLLSDENNVISQDKVIFWKFKDF